MRTARLLLVALALGCDPFNNPPSNDDVAGVYYLASVNGEPLPFTGPVGDVTMTVISSTLALELPANAAPPYPGHIVTQYADQPEPSAADLGWRWDGSLLTVSFADGESGSGWQDGRFTMQPPDSPLGSYLYRKRPRLRLKRVGRKLR